MIQPNPQMVSPLTSRERIKPNLPLGQRSTPGRFQISIFLIHLQSFWAPIGCGMHLLGILDICTWMSPWCIYVPNFFPTPEFFPNFFPIPAFFPNFCPNFFPNPKFCPNFFPNPDFFPNYCPNFFPNPDCFPNFCPNFFPTPNFFPNPLSPNS